LKSRVTDWHLWRSIAFRAVPAVVLVFGMSTYLVEDHVPGACDENVSPGSDLADGCSFLDDGGYTLIRLLPAAVVIAFAVLAVRMRRVGFVYVGLVLALVVQVFFLAATPNEYPFV
jgi:hypothetical protein